MNVNYPEIYLAIDNCFASKRWTSPSEWMTLSKDSGINYIEASADNECDPLYTCAEYLADWINQVKLAEAQTGVKVINLYSGHGSYATLGLAHPDPRIKKRMQKNWLGKMIDTAAKLDAGLGFFCHAFPQNILQEPALYYEAEADLIAKLAKLAFRAEERKVTLGVEQMYSPHQIPWTIEGAEDLIEKVYKISGKNFYITIDTGHQTGQRKFRRPSYGEIKEALRTYKTKGIMENLWLGSAKAHEMFKNISLDEDYGDLQKLMAEMDRLPYLFASYEDGDTYEWLERLGCFSPIIHLQQTDGQSSSHRPFTGKYNSSGTIDGKRILEAIALSYKRKHVNKPELCKKIYLTLEIFSGTAELPYDIISNLKESVKYWRQFIPEDGITLDKLISR